MSHELRTPLNSLLILAQLLAQNPTRNLTAKQVEYAGIIHSAGSDLLQLINDILDLSKVEAGKMDINPERVALRQLVDYVEATFRPLTTQKSLDFTITTAPGVPSELITDDSRLRQVLRNLISNAVKFTERGSVELRIETAPENAPARRRAARRRRPRLPREGHRHRHRRTAPRSHLRSLPAGGRHHEPQVRRHRPRPVDQPRDRPPARRRPDRGEHPPDRAVRSRCTCR